MWLGLFVSSRTPAATSALLNRELQKVLASPEMRQRFSEQGGKAMGGTPEAFASFVLAETTRWERVIRAANLKAD